MRGKVRRLHSVLARFGITPAYAGKSASTRSADRCMQDHPRLCGEKAGGVKMEIDVKGSPPPMRGKGSSVIFDCVISGITPAYAGKRERAVLYSARCAGSPPPMRGKGFVVYGDFCV